MPVAEAIALAFEDDADRVLAGDVFGTNTPEIVADMFLEHLDETTGAPVQKVRFFEQSVGSVLGVDLVDGRSVVVKVFGREAQGAHVFACCAAQAQLAEEPDRLAPAIIDRPREVQGRTMVTMALRDDGAFVDTRVARYRRQMALTLVLLSEQLGSRTLPMGIESRRPPEGALFPKPHNALFDFDGTAMGAETIDAVARTARSLLAGDPGDFVIGHDDWSAKNMRFDEESASVSVIYDWDALCHLEETQLCASAAKGYSVSWYVEGAGELPELEGMLAFVDEYEEARGRTFTGPERRRLYAHLVYSIAYTARCEHALGGGGVAARRLVQAAGLLR